MDWTSHVAVHRSALPHSARLRMLERLKERELDAALLYSGVRQTLRWVELHHAVSPAQIDASVASIYNEAFRAAAAECHANVVHVVSLACGDGTKDTRCLKIIRESGKTVIYTPADGSLEMVLTAEQTATQALRGLQTTPLVCELESCTILPGLLKSFDPSGAERVILFLGTIHNFWPPEILRSVIYPVRSQDHLVIGANLAPEIDYDAALERILSQYDNAPTQRWLMGGLSELDLAETDGRLEFHIVLSEADPTLKRIQADFVFERDKKISFFGERVAFAPGDKLRVFISYRFTIGHLRKFLGEAGLQISREWIAANGEEGLFLCRRKQD